MKRLLFVLPLILPISSLAAEPVVVHNFNQTAWDDTHGMELTAELRIGGDNQKDIAFGKIVHVACDSKGQIIAADYEKNEIRKFGADGSLIGPIGKGGDGPDEYQFIVAIAEDAQDNLYVVGSKRIRVYDAADKYVTDYRDDSGNYVRAMRVMPDGSLLLAEYDRPTNTVLQKYVAKKHDAHFGEPFKTGNQDSDEMKMRYAGGFIDVGPDGMIYYTQMSPYEIRTYTPVGDLVMQVFRENDFAASSAAGKHNNGMIANPSAGAAGIFVLSDGKFVNVTAVSADDGKPKAAVLDLFDAEGHLLLSHRLDGSFQPDWYDRLGNVYSFDQDHHAVVRSRLTIH